MCDPGGGQSGDCQDADLIGLLGDPGDHVRQDASQLIGQGTRH